MDAAKNQLQEIFQKASQPLPTYKTIDRGEPHCKEFKCTVTLYHGKSYSSVWTRTKKDAEKLAAYEAVKSMQSAHIPKQIGYSNSGGYKLKDYINVNPSPIPDSIKYPSNQRKSSTGIFNIKVDNNYNNNNLNGNNSNSNNNNNVKAIEYISKKLEDVHVSPEKHRKNIEVNEDDEMETIGGKPKEPVYTYETDARGRFIGGTVTYYNPYLKCMETQNSGRITLPTQQLARQQLELLMIAKLTTDQQDFNSHQADSIDSTKLYVEKNNDNNYYNNNNNNNNNQLPETKTKPRGYQIEFYNQSMAGDTICCLPTGLGKTLISCMVMRRMKTLNPHKRILFLVDRIPLVIQQSKLIERETGLKAIGLYGDVSKDILFGQFDVMVVISALFINFLKKKICSLEEYSLIVIDEAHHIVKDHPFSVVLREFYKKILDERLKPKILGLTASPAGKQDFFSTLLSLKVMSRVSNASIISPSPTAQKEIDIYNSKKNFRLIELSVNSQESFILQLVSKVTRHCQDQHGLVFDGKLNSRITSLVSDFGKDSPANDYNDDSDDDDNNNIANEMNFETYQSGQPNISNKRLKMSFEQFVKQFVEWALEYINFGKYNGDHAKYGNFSNIKECCKQMIARSKILIQQQKDELIFIVESVPLITDNNNTTNVCKLDKALEVLMNYNQTKEFRAIIFVQTRESAAILNEILTTLSASNPKYRFIKSQLVTGHGSTKEFGMSVPKQKQVVELFRSGLANVVVSTSVLEEGLDIPECNLVIRLDSPGTVTALIQSRGRLRNNDNEFVAIIKSNEGNSYKKFINQEICMQDAISFLRDGVVPSYYVEEVSSLIYCKNDVDQMIQKCKSAGFDLKFNLDTVFMQNSDQFVSSMSILGKVVAVGKGTSIKLAADQCCYHCLKNFTIPLIIKDL